MDEIKKFLYQTRMGRKVMSNIHEDYYNLQNKYKEVQDAIGDCLSHIYCIGGPLNDNVKGYTTNQLVDFFKIAHILKSVREVSE